MSTGFLVSLAVVVAVLLSARFLLAALPLRRVAVPVTITDVALAGVGILGLAFHCGAMFSRSLVEWLPGTGSVIREIGALGTGSVILYVVPALLVLLGLRRQHPVAPVVMALALAAVGVTMYDGGSLQAHLTAIFVAVVALAAVATMLTLPPWWHGPTVA
ncbi:MAG: hypothetical protein M3071_07820 [Actinomycetota bacterium]|nr:hypothetical protein [Actinomycetota bacterium]